MATTTTADRLLAEWASSLKTAEDYRALAEHARQLGLEYEVERLTSNADEYERDAEATFGECIARGIEP